MLLGSLSLSAQMVEKVNFKSQIWPIIEKSCIDCHNDQKKHPLNKKPKGGLQLDTPEMIMKGSGNGPVIIAGKPLDSSFYTLCILPEDHEDVMPSKGDLLTKVETDLIKKWIEQGPDFGVKLKSLPKPASKKSVKDFYDLAGSEIQPAKEAVVKYFNDRKHYMRPVKEGSSLLKLDFLMNESLVSEDFIKLKTISPQLVYLNLARTNVKDGHLSALGSLKKLAFLHLERTSVSDSGMRHVGRLVNLQYLNLYGTKVSDKSIQSLVKLKNLQKLYLWNTKFTKAGIQKLRKLLPKTDVNFGE